MGLNENEKRVVPASANVLIAKPTPKFIEAVMRTLQVVNNHPSHLSHRNGSPYYVIRGSIQRNYLFVPPAELWGDQNKLSPLIRGFWEDVTRKVYEMAQDETLDMPGALNGLDGNVITEVFMADSTNAISRWVWWNIDTTVVQTEAEIIASQKDLVGKLSDKLRAGIIAVSSDARKMDIITKASAVKGALVREFAFEDRIKYTEHVRAQIEKPDEQQKYLEILKQALDYLEFSEVDVQLLAVRDAVFRNCEGLYELDRGQAKVSIPMSHYGTLELLTLDKTWEILAHELAHHKMHKDGISDNHPEHGQIHNAETQELLRRLRKLRPLVENDKVKLVEEKIIDEKLLKSTIRELIPQEVIKEIIYEVVRPIIEEGLSRKLVTTKIENKYSRQTAVLALFIAFLSGITATGAIIQSCENENTEPPKAEVKSQPKSSASSTNKPKKPSTQSPSA